MDQTEALKILIQGINVAQKRGAYDLQEASVLAKAAAAFVEPVSAPNTKKVENEQSE